jgi:hypothetical protein
LVVRRSRNFSGIVFDAIGRYSLSSGAIDSD